MSSAVLLLSAQAPRVRCARARGYNSTIACCKGRQHLCFTRTGRLSTLQARAKKEPSASSATKAKDAKYAKTPKKPQAGPPPPVPAEPHESNGAAKADDDALVEPQPELATSERLLEAIKVGDSKAAEELANTVIAEQETLAAAVEAAEGDTKAGKKTLDQLKDQYRRLQADFDNFRSRAEADKTQTGKNVKMSVVQDLLPLVDNFELAASQIKPTNEAEEKISNSYQGLYRQMVDIFRGMGLEAIPTVGTPFDPEMHDGIMKEETTTEPDNVVLEEFRKGFKFSGKLLRPAMVKVAVNTSSSEKPAKGGVEAPAAEVSSSETDAAASS